MALQITIPGIRCNQETKGRGDDEILVIAAAVPVDTVDRVWTYADRWTDGQFRYLPDVNTGDAHDFGPTTRGVQQDGPQGPIQFTVDATANRAIEIWFYVGEVDAGQDFLRAVDGYRQYRTQLADLTAPGNHVGHNLDARRDWAGPATGDGIQTLAYDIWTINMAQPLNGSIDADYPANPGPGNITAPNRADAVYKNRKDWGLSETRSYVNTDEESRYTMDTEYRLVD